MKHTAWTVVLMLLAAAVGFYIGAWVDDSMGGAIVFSVIAGTGCIVHAIDTMKRS